jgi:endothelin-converting enzyme/putative endopeptidase
MRMLGLLGLMASAAYSQTGFDILSLNRTVDPCGNFYQFACGGWTASNPLPGDAARWGRFDALQERNRVLLRQVLENAATPRADRPALAQKIGDYYAACMSDEASGIRSMDSLQRDLNRLSVIASKTELTDAAVYMIRLGSWPFFFLSSEQDARDSSQMIAGFDQGGLSLPDRDYYLKTDPASVQLREQFRAHVERVFGLLGESAGEARRKAAAVLEIETALAQASLDRVSRRDPEKVYHKMAVGEFTALAPAFDWVRFIESIGTPAITSLNVAVPEFAAGFSKLIEERSLEDIKAYLAWTLVNDLTPVLSAELRQARFEFFERALLGAKEPRARWKQCVDMTDRQLPDALGKTFLETTLGEQGQQRMRQMVAAIEAALERDIRGLDWMTAETKERAIEKLHKIANKVGNQEKWQDYASVRIARDDAYGNSARAAQFETARQLAKIGKPVDKTEWFMSQPTVNAYYDAQNNNINFPAGILQPPFYDNAMDDAVNFGAIGAVIGHELTHGFDDQGRQYDGDGNLRDWWTAADAGAFQERAACLVDQYAGYSPLDGVTLNGRLTLGENTADNGGLRIAYMALMDQIKDRLPEPVDGFNAEQRFFLGWAQVWCQNITAENLRVRAQTDTHSPGEFRVNGVVSNMPEFQRAFGCRADQPMARRPACRVW